MSTVGSVGSSATVYQPKTPGASAPNPAASTSATTKAADRDGDGDTDGKGVDVKG
jgi:hypothetical protein